MTRRLSNADEARYDRAADRVEAMDGLPADSAVVDGSPTQAGRDLMNELFGSPAAVERAMGRPSVDGSMTAGHSPVVRVRLPRDLDAMLTLRARAEHRNRSDVVRAALAAYLAAS